jgi:hypothetical protein
MREMEFDLPGIETVACSGLLDLRAQAALLNLLRSDTPPQVSWNVMQAQGALGEGLRRATTQQTPVVSGVYISLML